VIKIRIKANGEVKEVTRNEAFDLIDRGLAELYKAETPKSSPFSPPTISDRQVSGNSYLNRQMHSSKVDKGPIRNKRF